MKRKSSDQTSTDFDVAIIGLGPVGATLVNLLGLRGIRVLVLEREDETYPLPRAVHFDDECMRVFQTIGLAEEASAISAPSRGMRYLDLQGNVIIESPRPQELSAHGWHHGYRFHQPELERLLVKGASRWPSVQVRRRSDVFALDQCEQCVAVRFEDLASGEIRESTAKFVVGCDGARSIVRRFIGSNLLDLGFHERWLVVDVLLKVPRPDLGEFSVQHCNPARSATYVCGTGNRRRWEIRLHANEPSKEMMQPSRAWDLLAQWLTVDEADIERQAVYTFHSVLAEKWRSERLLLAGDSAHQTPPFLGQGMCAGIRDASNLAWKLEAVLHGRADEALLDTYQSERSPHVRDYIELAVKLGGVINTTAMNPVLPNSVQTSDKSVRLERNKPTLGRGYASGESRLIGSQIPQPLLLDGRRLDDSVGFGFCLLLRTGHADTLSCDVTELLSRSQTHILDDASPDLQRWLMETGHLAVLVRPDRYVFGGAANEDELVELLSAAFATAPAAAHMAPHHSEATNGSSLKGQL